MSEREVSRSEVVAVARSWLGTPYHHQVSVHGVGCDCLGLVRGVFETVCDGDIESVPAYSGDWAEARGRETLLEAANRYLLVQSGYEDAQAGDVLIFRLSPRSLAKHTGILSGPGKMIHAQEKVGCVEVSLGRWWKRRVAAVYSFPGVR